MPSSSLLPLLIASFLLLLASFSCQGFSVFAPAAGRIARHQQPSPSSPWIRLAAEASESSEPEGAATEEASAEDEEEEEEEEEEDPELKALKEEIANLESELKAKRRTLQGTKDKADDFTKTGYARKVAEMENMRRARKMLQSSDREGAIASTLAEFLPVYEKLSSLSTNYADDDFGKQYGALLSSMKQAYTDLGVTEYYAQVGDAVDGRMVVVESNHSEEQPADTVLEVLAGGLELKGNIVKFTEVVASLGPEGADDEEDEEKSSGEEGDATPAAE